MELKAASRYPLHLLPDPPVLPKITSPAILLSMNDTFDLEIQGLAHDGRGVARHEGRVILVSGALPGQTVHVRLLRRRTRLWEAVALKILRPAVDTVPPLCPHQGLCGGCPLQTMPYNVQLQWKRRLALDALTRIGKLERSSLEERMPMPLASPNLTAYRNKMEFSFGIDANGALVLGQRQRGSLNVVSTPGCVLVPETASDILIKVEHMAAETGLAAYSPPYSERRKTSRRQRTSTKHVQAGKDGFWRFLTLRQGLLDGQMRWWAVLLTSPGRARERAVVRGLAERLLKQCPLLAAVIHEERCTSDALCAGEGRVAVYGAYGDTASKLHLPLGGHLFLLDAKSFFQVNTGAAELLAREICDMLPAAGVNRALLDVYCGVGAPGLLLARSYTSTMGIEYDTQAVDAARQNAYAAGLRHCHFEAGDAANVIRDLGGMHRFQDVLLDPPRGGVDKSILDRLLSSAAERILYVSCNPSTLARDALTLQKAYILQDIRAVDLFPHTPHLECISLWCRKKTVASIDAPGGLC